MTPLTPEGLFCGGVGEVAQNLGSITFCTLCPILKLKYCAVPYEGCTTIEAINSHFGFLAVSVMFLVSPLIVTVMFL